MDWSNNKLQSVSYAGDYRLHVRYADSLEADVDLADLLEHPFYASLKDKARFAQVRIDPEVPILVWPGDIDLAPELLFERAKAQNGKS